MPMIAFVYFGGNLPSWMDGTVKAAASWVNHNICSLFSTLIFFIPRILFKTQITIQVFNVLTIFNIHLK